MSSNFFIFILEGVEMNFPSIKVHLEGSLLLLYSSFLKNIICVEEI